jgi:hypothetical protein
MRSATVHGDLGHTLDGGADPRRASTSMYWGVGAA